MNQDEEHLRLLSIFHYVVAGLGALLACIPMVHLTLGILMATGNFPDGKSPPPPFMGWILIGVASALILGGWTLAALIAYAGRCLKRRVKYTYCLVIAAIACALCTPFGTILVLLRPSVKAMFGLPLTPDAPPPEIAGA